MMDRSDKPKTLFDKIWDRHEIHRSDDGPSLLYVDRDFIHEGSFHAFNDLRRRGLSVARPAQVFGIPDHYVPTVGRKPDLQSRQLAHGQLRHQHEVVKVNYFPLNDARQGIVP